VTADFDSRWSHFRRWCRQADIDEFPTEREARRALTDTLARLDRGVYVDRTRLSGGDYLDQWLEGRVNLRPASVLFYRVVVDRYLKPELGSLRLSDLRADDNHCVFARIRRGVDGRGQPVSPALIGRLETTLRAALNVAGQRGLVHMNVAQHVEVVAHARPVVRVCDAATTARFLVATADTPYGALWHLIASFGLRRGEAAGLRWLDVDLDVGVVLIAVQRNQLGKTVQETARRRRRGHARACQHGGSPPLRLHDLQHTSASLGLAAGETLVEISKRLGHSQLAVTADTYTHVLPVVALASSEKRAALIPRAGAAVAREPDAARASPRRCAHSEEGSSAEGAPPHILACQPCWRCSPVWT
jgi:site-specific recombinase XerC